MNQSIAEQTRQREAVANRPKHWVRAVTACNSRCLFCLDSDTPRNLFLPYEDVIADLQRGRDELGAERVVISGGEGSLHPRFADFVRHSKAIGYDRVQTVTNGWMFAEKAFYDRVVDAGLGEITFSLHGHTAALHDRLTGTPGAFARLVKGMVRARRDPRVIVNVDVCINRQNVAVLDRIVELCLRLGVNEFDLLHVIPQASAFEHRDALFYDPRDHIETLHRVFRLNRHPGVTVWTNRFPVSYLEGFEDLIQDPHKMLDEINGRRFMVRSYLDTGEPLQCRDPERCVHCFVEPLCTTMDRTIAAQNADAWDVWWIGEPRPVDSLPFGCGRVGIRADALDELAVARPDGAGLYVELDSVEPLAGLPAGPITLVATAAEPLRAWLSQPLAESVSLEIRLNRDTAGVVAERAEDLAALGDRVLVHQPGFETLAAAADSDVRDPRAFFGGLEAPLRVSGLPACLIPGMRWAEEPRILDAALFDADTGRLSIRALARDHVTRSYRAKSLRCRECALDDRCDGEHINRLRDQGLSVLTPLSEIPDGHPGPRLRLATGAAPQPPAPSLPGFERPTAATTDPLAEYARIRADRLAARARRAADRDG